MGGGGGGGRLRIPVGLEGAIGIIVTGYFYNNNNRIF